MKKIIMIILVGLFATSTRVNSMCGDNYDDIAGFFESFSRQMSKDIECTYISKAMIKHANLPDVYGISTDKIDFVRMINASNKGAAETYQKILDFAHSIEAFGFTKLLQTDIKEESMITRNFLFTRSGEGGLSLILTITICVDNTPEMEVIKWRATFLGGTFTINEISEVFPK